MTDISDDTSPVISGLTTIEYQENQTAVFTYSANETVSWSLSGTDSSLFNISNTGGLSFSSAPDYEAPLDDGANNEYNLVVTATDSSSNTSDLSVTITVTDVNDTVDLIITGSESVSVEENQTTVSTYSANETVSWSLSELIAVSLIFQTQEGFHSAQPLIMKRHLMMEQTMNII